MATLVWGEHANWVGWNCHLVNINISAKKPHKSSSEVAFMNIYMCENTADLDLCHFNLHLVIM